MSRGFGWMQGAGTRKNLSFFVINQDFQPLEIAERHALLPALECVRWAPSAYNRQCVRVMVISESLVHFFVEPGNKYLYQDAGLAVYHFGAVVAEKGLNGKWTRTPDAAPTHPGFVYVATWKF